MKQRQDMLIGGSTVALRVITVIIETCRLGKKSSYIFIHHTLKPSFSFPVNMHMQVAITADQH
jgi:hypothetical protein